MGVNKKFQGILQGLQGEMPKPLKIDAETWKTEVRSLPSSSDLIKLLTFESELSWSIHSIQVEAVAKNTK